MFLTLLAVSILFFFFNVLWEKVDEGKGNCEFIKHFISEKDYSIRFWIGLLFINKSIFFHADSADFLKLQQMAIEKLVCPFYE